MAVNSLDVEVVVCDHYFFMNFSFACGDAGKGITHPVVHYHIVNTLVQISSPYISPFVSYVHPF